MLFKSILSKSIVIATLLSIGPLSLAGYKIIKIYQQEKREAIIQSHREKANLISEKTRSFLENTIEILTVVSQDSILYKKEYFPSKAYLKSHLQAINHLLDIFILDHEGRELLRVSKEGISNLKEPYRKEILRGLSRGKVYYGDFFFTSSGIPTLCVANLFTHPQDKAGYIIGARVNLQSLSELIKNIRIGDKGSAYVIDQEGLIIASQDENAIFWGPFVSQAISGNEGHIEFSNVRDERFLIVYKTIPSLNWGVITQIPIEEIQAPIKNLTKIALYWIFIAFCLSLIMSLLLMRRLVYPIKKLSHEMIKVSRGDFETKMDISRKDEIGLLNRSFKQMVNDLKKAQEKLQETERKYRNIFENSKDMIYITSTEGQFIDVNQAGVEMLGYKDKEELMGTDVSEVYWNPEERRKFQIAVAKEGFVKDFEVKFKKRDGTPIYCLITATARKDEKGEIIGYEGNIKDITLRKRIEEELSNRTKELEMLYDLSVLINQSLDLESIIPTALEKVLSLTGFEMGTIYLLSEDKETLELKYHKNYPSHLVAVVGSLKRGEGVAGLTVEKKDIILSSIDQYPTHSILPHLKTEGVKTLVGIPLISKGETVGAICLTSREHHTLHENEINFLRSIGNQIGMALENAKLFSNVAKAKEEWEVTFNSVTDLITVRDPEYRIIRANQTAFKRYGLRPEEMIGKRCFEILHQGEKPCEGCYVRKTLETLKPVCGERYSKYLNGVFQYYTFPIYDEEGRVAAIVDLAREITEEKKKALEQEVLSNINKILASTLDVRDVIGELYKELKRVIDTERVSITLLDEKGIGFQYFPIKEGFKIGDEWLTDSRAEIFLKDKNSFEEVIETGKPVIISNTEESDSWVNQKLFREGIRSFLVFPLEYKGKVIGTLNLGSGKPNYFSETQFPFLFSLATSLVISIQNSLLFEETKKRLKEVTLLYEMMKLSASSFNLQKILKEMTNQLNCYFSFDTLGILLIDEKTERLIPCSPSYDPLTIKQIEELNLSLGRGITGWVARTGEPLMVGDVRKDPRYLPGKEGILSEICVPIQVGQKIIGVIDGQSRRLNAFSEEDFRILKVVGSQLGVIIENLRLYEEVRRSEENYRTVIEGAHEGICVIGLDNRFRFVNKRMEEIQGYPEEEIIGKDFNEFIDEESRRYMVERFARWKRGERLPSTYELVIRRKDGEWRNVEINARAIKDHQGEVNYIVFVKDITEHKKMEERVLQAEKLRAVAEMASGVAHDFNNALAAILGNTQLLLHVTEDEEIKETLRTIEKVAKDSAHTVKRLQDFTRKKTCQELFDVDVNPIVRDSIEMSKPKWRDEAQRKGITIEVVTQFEEVSPVLANAPELKEVIINMIFNAVEALPQGGRIEIRTFQKEDRVCIEISDTGIGMSEEVKKRIFEPFFTTKPFTNTGLGLSMSYGIIKRFGGEIDVESKIGKGTTFTILLPIGKGKREEERYSSTSNFGKKARILVVEDEETVRNVLIRTLAQVPHEVTTADNGEEGLKLFKTHRFDIVLTDLGMPGVSGWEVCRRIKEISPETPVGMITGWGMEIDQEKAKEVGLDFLISKPFDFNHLLKTVNEAINSREKRI